MAPVIARYDVRPEGATPTDAPREAWKYPWGDASLRDSGTTHERGEQSSVPFVFTIPTEFVNPRFLTYFCNQK